MIVAGILTPLENIFRHILDWLHGTAGLPWAWAIVVLTVIVRCILVPLTVRQIHSMQNLQRHAPQMKEIQKKYKGDKQKQNEELMRFYKENQINPAASCLPMVAQLPVFIGLYYSLRHFAKHPPGGQAAVERGDFSWLGHNFVPDITAHANAHWSGYLLLAIYAISQVSSTLLMSTTMEKSQRMIMLVLPLVFISFLLKFPTGLVVYWVTTNLWTVGQGLITRRLMPKTAAPARKSSRSPPKDDDGPGNGARRQPTAPKPAPAAKTAGTPAQVRRVKKKQARR